jgi:23S rRNA (adenine2030-N6)-methyltransferase
VGFLFSVCAKFIICLLSLISCSLIYLGYTIKSCVMALLFVEAFIMNYLHHYHAGNFADVFKHFVLLELVKFLQKKETPLAFYDTHAGAGAYDLAAIPSQKTGEWKGGIGRVWNHKDPDWQELLDLVRETNDVGELRFYPGSPLLFAEKMRLNDELILCETSDGPMRHLRNNLGRERRVHIHQRDGYEGLIALLPPKTAKRALIHIDPPFEEDDFKTLVSVLPQALMRFRQGIFAIWYPIKTRAATLPFTNRLKNMVEEENKFLNLTIMIGPENSLAMNGCGMAIVNAPFGFAELIQPKIKKLENLLKCES